MDFLGLSFIQGVPRLSDLLRIYMENQAVRAMRLRKVSSIIHLTPSDTSLTSISGWAGITAYRTCIVATIRQRRQAFSATLVALPSLVEQTTLITYGT